METVLSLFQVELLNVSFPSAIQELVFLVSGVTEVSLSSDRFLGEASGNEFFEVVQGVAHIFVFRATVLAVVLRAAAVVRRRHRAVRELGAINTAVVMVFALVVGFFLHLLILVRLVVNFVVGTHLIVLVIVVFVAKQATGGGSRTE